MTFVITAPCVDIKDGDCVNVCPVDCIYEGGHMFYIHPTECIACALCESICPVDAIHHADDVPPQWRDFIAVNADYFGAAVTGLGSPNGAKAVGPVDSDPAVVRDHPAQRLNTAGDGAEPAAESG